MTQIDIWEKTLQKKTSLKTFVLFENDQPIMHAKLTEKNLTEFLKLKHMSAQ